MSPTATVIFADLDACPWPKVRHAYGTAEDVPDLLRALVSADGEAAAEAEEELWSSLVHQGTVYEATAHAVPYLARLAAAGVRRAHLLGMLGAIAESTDEHDLSVPGAARAAVAAELPLLLPLLADPDPRVRQCTARTVAQCRSAAGEAGREGVRRRWEAESDPVVRADVLSAWAVLSPQEVMAGPAEAALSGDEPAPVRIAAVLACLEAGRAWDVRLAAVVTDLLPLREHAAGSLWEREPLAAVAERLRARGEADAAIDLVAGALHRATAASTGDAMARKAVSAEAVWAAERLARRSRSAPERLLPAMLPLLDTPGTAAHALDAVRIWGQPAHQAVPALIRLAAEEGDLGGQSLAALVALGAPEAADLLARDLKGRPRALDAASGFSDGTWVTPLPCTPALLDAVRTRLTDPSLGRREEAGLTSLATVNEPSRLAGLLTAWGPTARAALPELLDALPRHPCPVAPALAAIADPRTDPHVVTALREHAQHGGQRERQAAAAALHTLTGDPGPILAVLGAKLDEKGNDLDDTVRAAARLGEQARPLLPRLLTLLAEPADARQTTPAIGAALKAAALAWRLTGDHEAALPVVLEGLAWGAEPCRRWTAIRAARLAALLGPATALAVTPYLLQMLDRHEQAPAAVRALAALHPGSEAPAGISRTSLADHVLAAVQPGANLNTALAAVEAIAALGPDALTPAQLERIRLWADGDQRIVRFGSHTELIHDDEHFRSRAQAALDALTS